MWDLLKLAPLVAVVAGGDKIQEKIKPVRDVVQSVAVQAELNEISKFVILGESSGDTITEDTFADYLRENMDVAQANENAGATQRRDLAKDLFGTLYKFERRGKSIRVTSAGADKQFDTWDDLYSQRKAM